jgi:RimJ/RimL family protein N-acetyltransferase
MPLPELMSAADARPWIQEAKASAPHGAWLPFAAIYRPSGQAVGSTRSPDIRRADRALEIGWTWLGIPYQRTPINTEGKYLLLRHACEAPGAVRVQLTIDRRNERSQKAIERIGATREGVLRKPMVLWDGFIRGSVYSSILDDEWPSVRRHLEALLARQRCLTRACGRRQKAVRPMPEPLGG